MNGILMNKLSFLTTAIGPTKKEWHSLNTPMVKTPTSYNPPFFKIKRAPEKMLLMLDADPMKQRTWQE